MVVSERRCGPRYRRWPELAPDGTSQWLARPGGIEPYPTRRTLLSASSTR